MATTNVIELAEKFQPILDEIYQLASLTARMDAKSKPIEFAGANVVKIYKTTLYGLGTYSRNDGYPDGDVLGAWETLTLATERGRKMFIDRMDDEETLGMAFGTTVGEYMRIKVIPEVDAYRMSKYASWAGIGEVGVPATLDATTIIAAIDAGSLILDEAEVPAEGRLLYISSTCNRFLQAAITRVLGNEGVVDRRLKTLDELTILPMPQSRMYKGITLDAGAAVDAGGYAKTGVTGRDINFLMLHPSAVVQVKKHDKLKLFDPDTNQEKDGWSIQYRIYHDAFVYDNKVDGIYSHIKAT